jgi:hypothetical protein
VYKLPAKFKALCSKSIGIEFRVVLRINNGETLKKLWLQIANLGCPSFQQFEALYSQEPSMKMNPGLCGLSKIESRARTPASPDKKARRTSSRQFGVDCAEKLTVETPLWSSEEMRAKETSESEG